MGEEFLVNDPEKPPAKDARNPYARSWSAERPQTELPPEQPAEQPAKKAKGIGAVLVGLGLLAAKFKGLLLLLLNFKWVFFLFKFLGTGGSLLISLWVYALFWPWQFALVFVLMILAHELGHYFAIRGYGLPAKLPMFIPLMGAYTVGGVPESLEHDAYIALAGPLTGLGVAGLCYAFGIATRQPFWFAAAYVGAFLNLFNMVPTPPFDGGRIAGALSPQLWIVGFALFIGGSLALHLNLIFVLIFGLVAIPSVIAALRGHVDPRSATMTAPQRVKVALWYMATLFALVYLMSISHIAVPTR